MVRGREGVMDGSQRPRSPDPAALAAFFFDGSQSLLADLRDAGVLAGADEAGSAREWTAAALHACIRGVVSDGGHGDETADLVDEFHDLVLARLGSAVDAAEWRAHLAARYDEYDGITRTLGKDGAARVPATIAAACARHVRPADRAMLSETLAPLLEALAEGAARTLAEVRRRSSAPVAATPSGGGVRPGLRLPPIEPLRRLTARLDAEGIAWAVGASGLLASLDLVDEVNDWDVQVEAEPEKLQWLFVGVPHTFHGHGGCHADWKLAFEAERAELIPRFAFYAPAGIVNLPVRVSHHWHGLPIASPEAWACAYWLMGQYDAPSLRARRAERAEWLFARLAERGADAGRIEELLVEPLPEPLMGKLRSLVRG
jgi:hypothetical protein